MSATADSLVGPVRGEGAPRAAHLRVLRALGEAGVRHVLLRGAPGEGDDLDLLVHPRDVARASMVLARLGLPAAPSEHHWPHRLFVGGLTSDGDDGGADGVLVVVVDLLDRLVVRSRHLGGRAVAAVLVEQGRPDADGVQRPAPQDRAWLEVLAHGLRREPPTRPLPATSLVAGAQLGALLDGAAGAGTAAAVVAAAATGSADAVRDALSPLRDRPLPVSLRAARALALWRGRAGAGRRPARGVRVVLLGPDGAGKSTLSQGLRETLPLPVHEIYMGVFRVDTWHRVSRYLPGAGLTTRLFRLWWRSLRATWLVRRGHVVVFDRYTYDAGLRPGSRGLRSRVSYWAIERACPQPDVVLLLDAPGAVLFARKGEHDVATLEERRGWYRSLVEGLPPQITTAVLDATQPAAHVLARARATVWHALRQR